MTDRIFFHFGPFLPFYPTNNPKNQNFEKMKKSLEISPFYTSVPQIMIICYIVPEIWCMTDVICIFHFGLFFELLPQQPEKPQSKKMKKTPGDIYLERKTLQFGTFLSFFQYKARILAYLTLSKM